MKGPSVTVTFPPESRTRAPSAVGPSPPLPSIVPALVSSSASFAIASISCLGGGPCFSACLTIIMNRIVISPLGFEVGAGHPDGFDRLNPSSTYWSNEGQRNRQVRYHFFGKYSLNPGNALPSRAAHSFRPVN